MRLRPWLPLRLVLLVLSVCGQTLITALYCVALTHDLDAQLQVMGVIIERDSLSRIEIGTRFVTDYEIVALAKCLKVSINWLLGEE